MSIPLKRKQQTAEGRMLTKFSVQAFDPISECQNSLWWITYAFSLVILLLSFSESPWKSCSSKCEFQIFKWAPNWYLGKAQIETFISICMQFRATCNKLKLMTDVHFVKIWDLFLESPSKSYFEIKVPRNIGWVLNSNEIKSILFFFFCW